MRSFLRLGVLVLGVSLWCPARSRAGEDPEGFVRRTVTEVFELVKDPGLQGEDKEAQLRAKLSQLARGRFDFALMAALSLGRYRQQFNADQLAEFTELFTQLLERAYLDKIQGAKDEKVEYAGAVRRAANRAVVNTKVITGGGAIPISYSVTEKEGAWRIYDVNIEGVGLVGNYRSQFREVLVSKPPQHLIDRLKEKVAKDDDN